jgi:hypothetical protein
MADAPDSQDALASYVPPAPSSLSSSNHHPCRFMSITGADSGSAMQFLELTNWKLAEAVRPSSFSPLDPLAHARFRSISTWRAAVKAPPQPSRSLVRPRAA